MITVFQSNKILNEVFGATALTAPAKYFLGLSKTHLTNTGTGITEPTNADYARKEIANTKTTFSTATAGVIKNLIDISFKESLTDWTTGTEQILDVFISDALTGGNVLYYDVLKDPITLLPKPRKVESYSTLYFPVNSIEIKLTSA